MLSLGYFVDINAFSLYLYYSHPLLLSLVSLVVDKARRNRHGGLHFPHTSFDLVVWIWIGLDSESLPQFMRPVVHEEVNLLSLKR